MANPLLTRITSDPAIFGGKPIIRGQRFAVEHLLGYLGAGMSEAELLAEFPFLEPDDIKAALLYAGKLSGMTRMSGAAVGAAVKKRKLLLDSCLPKAMAAHLRADGHDVAAVAEGGADPGDAAILARAVAEGRVLVTIDSDFGALVFRDGARRAGVLRLRAQPADALAHRTRALLAAYGDDLEAGAFVTDDGDAARLTPPEKHG